MTEYLDWGSLTISVGGKSPFSCLGPVCWLAGFITGWGKAGTGNLPIAKAKNAWVHVDGAFGLWAAASDQHRHLVQGVELADSWSVDLHKWLNVPYDSGVVVSRFPQYTRAAMSINAAYLPSGNRYRP